jgi:hypothetical protein
MSADPEMIEFDNFFRAEQLKHVLATNPFDEIGSY